MNNFKLKSNCETCNSNSGLTRSHFVKKNSVHKTIKDYDYELELNWFTQCLQCHIIYERFPVRTKTGNLKYRFSQSLITRESYLRRKGLDDYANRIKYLVEGIKT